MSHNEATDLNQHWPEANRFRRSIRLEFTLFISIFIVMLMGVTGYVITEKYVDTVTRGIVDRLLVQARSYSGPAGKHIIATDSPDALMLGNICKKIASDNHEVYWAGIADRGGHFLAHTDLKQVISGASMQPLSREDSEFSLKAGETLQLGKDTILITAEIAENGVMIGTLAVASSADDVHQARLTTYMTVGSITLVMLLVGLPLIMLTLHRKLRPITVITDHLKQVDLTNIELDIPIKLRNELGYLSETLRVMGGKLNQAQKNLVEKERIERELEIAREIQINILPKEYPRTANLEFWGHYLSAREVGGDYYDFIDFGDGQLAVIVADVSGKSLPGMLVMLLTRDIIKDCTRRMRQPAEVLGVVNAELRKSIRKGSFVTMFYGLLDTNTGSFCFASAGHNPLIIMDSATNEIQTIKTKGFPLGVMNEKIFAPRLETSQVNLSAGQWLIQYTDGINEAHNEQDEEYGMERFLDVLKEYSALSPQVLIEKTLASHQAFSGEADQYDDITLMAMKWKGQIVDKRDTEKTRETVIVA